MQPSVPTPAELKTLLVDRLDLTPEGAESFLNPEYKLGNLFAFTDMKGAVERIKQALDTGEHIGIYADYDCDGIPGAVVLVDLFKKLGKQEFIHIYIPDRHDEGYGISTQGIDTLESQGVTLMITVDVGITAVAQIADAQSRGIDVILTDHHAPLATGLPAAYAVIHPTQGSYTNQDPCGAAVAFYLACAFLETYRDEYGVPEGWEKWLLDLVGFATLADMVPLTGENRVLAYFGIQVMKKGRRVGIATLLAQNNVSLQALTESDLTFTVAPRLNAASRMDTPMLAFELLATEDAVEARRIVDILEAINAERKTLVAKIAKAAHTSIDHRIASEGELHAIVVVGNPEWRPAVLGLVANKLQETYNRSFFVWGESGDGSIKGSCRMVSDHHAALLFQALPDDVLLHAGGHQAAGGFSTTKDQIHFLEQALNDALGKVSHDTDEANEYPAIALPLAATTPRHLLAVRWFAPFGVGNPEPLFQFDSVQIMSAKLFGKNKEHLECVVKDETGSATAFTFFVSKDVRIALIPGAIVSLVGTLEAGWRGGVRVRIKEVF